MCIQVQQRVNLTNFPGPHHVERGADGADHVAPDAAGVHDLHGRRQLELGQLAVFWMEKDLEVALQHTRQLVTSWLRNERLGLQNTSA